MPGQQDWPRIKVVGFRWVGWAEEGLDLTSGSVLLVGQQGVGQTWLDSSESPGSPSSSLRLCWHPEVPALLGRIGSQ